MSKKIVLLFMIGLIIPYIGCKVTTSGSTFLSKQLTQTIISPKIKEAFNKHIPSIKVDNDISIRSFISRIAKMGDLNIIVTNEVKGKMSPFVTKELKDITLGALFESVLTSNRLAMEIKGNIINVMTEAEYQSLYGLPYNDKKQLKIIKLKYVKPMCLYKILEAVKSRVGRAVMDNATSTIILIDVPEKLKQAEEVIRRLDVLIETKVFELKYATIAEIEPLINKLRSPDISSMKINERTRKIMVTDTPEALKKITELIETFDTKSHEEKK